MRRLLHMMPGPILPPSAQGEPTRPEVALVIVLIAVVVLLAALVWGFWNERRGRRR